MGEYITLGNLYIYQLAIQLSGRSWEIYEKMDWRIKKTIGDQFITSIDSVGANIAEGYGRYHYLDKVKFYYNARGSLFEAEHWSYLLYKRNIITEELFNVPLGLLKEINFGLNKLIKATKLTKDEQILQS